MSLLRSIITYRDYLFRRYEAFPVRDDATLKSALAVLDEVRRNELKRVHGRSALESAAFVDADVRDELYALKDRQIDKVIGCIRITRADQLAAIPESREEYQLDKLPPALLGRTQVFTRLAILRQYRKTAAFFILWRRLYDDTLGAQSLATLLSCEPGLYAGYLRMGCRPLGSVHQAASGGFRIPMVHIHHDIEYLRRVRSPMLAQLARIASPLPQQAVEWYRQLEAREGSIDAGVTFFGDHATQNVHTQLTRGLTPAGRAQLLHNAMEVRCRPGDVILRQGDGGRSMGFVQRGKVQVKHEGRVVAMLGEGELFGEMATVLDAPRTADVIATGPDTQILMLSQNCLNRLKGKADITQVWRNLANVLAGRMHLACQ
jgi:hypothetical protein